MYVLNKCKIERERTTILYFSFRIVAPVFNLRGGNLQQLVCTSHIG